MEYKPQECCGVLHRHILKDNRVFLVRQVALFNMLISVPMVGGVFQTTSALIV